MIYNIPAVVCVGEKYAIGALALEFHNHELQRLSLESEVSYDAEFDLLFVSPPDYAPAGGGISIDRDSRFVKIGDVAGQITDCDTACSPPRYSISMSFAVWSSGLSEFERLVAENAKAWHGQQAVEENRVGAGIGVADRRARRKLFSFKAG